MYIKLIFFSVLLLFKNFIFSVENPHDSKLNIDAEAPMFLGVTWSHTKTPFSGDQAGRILHEIIFFAKSDDFKVEEIEVFIETADNFGFRCQIKASEIKNSIPVAKKISFEMQSENKGVHAYILLKVSNFKANVTKHLKIEVGSD